MSRLTRDGTAEPVSRDQILRHARGQGNIIFPVQLTTSRIGNLTRLIHTLLYVMTIHTYIHTSRAASIDSDCCRLPTTSVLSNKSDKNVPTSFDQQFQVSQGHTSHRTKIGKIEIPRSMVVEALSWRSRRASQHPAVQSPVHP